MEHLTVAVDGPVASGKSTVALLLAKRLGVPYVDTGAMYRAVALMALRENIPIEDAAAVAALALRMSIGVEYDPESTVGYRLLVDGEDVTGLLHTPEVAAAVSPVSEIPEVREVMVARQRRLAGEKPVIMAGRDIGTVVLPHAKVKFFITAQEDVRAKRRYDELKEKGMPATYDEVLENVRSRDRIDSTRDISPLKAAEDAVLLDTSGFSITAVVDEMERIVKNKTGESLERSAS